MEPGKPTEQGSLSSPLASRDAIIQWLLADYQTAHEHFLSHRSGMYQIIFLTAGFGGAVVAGGAFVWEEGLPAVLVFAFIVPLAIFGGTLGILARVSQQIALREYLDSIEFRAWQLLGPELTDWPETFLGPSKASPGTPAQKKQEGRFGYYRWLASTESVRHQTVLLPILWAVFILGMTVLSEVIARVRLLTPLSGEKVIPTPWIEPLAVSGPLFLAVLTVFALVYWFLSAFKRSQRSAGATGS